MAYIKTLQPGISSPWVRDIYFPDSGIVDTAFKINTVMYLMRFLQFIYT